MVSALKYFRQDPMYPRKDRGAGWYYHRGNLKRGVVRAGQQNPASLRGEYWSKYSETLDGKKAHYPKKVRNIQKSEEFQAHKADYKTRVIKRDGRKIVTFKTKRVPTTPHKGFF